MSLLTAAFLMERYGPLLNEDQVGEVLHISGATVRNRRALGTFPIPAAETSGRLPLFHAQDVANYVDGLRVAVASEQRRGRRAATAA